MKRFTTLVRALTAAAALIAACGGLPAGAADGTWAVDADGLWSEMTNWQSGVVASGSGSTAFFNAVDLTADRAVQLDADYTLTNLVFGDSGSDPDSNWTLGNNGLSTNNLILAGTTPTISVESATTTIQAVIEGGGLTKQGAGTLMLSGSNTYTGVTQIFGGTLNVATLSNYGADGSLGNRSKALDDTGGENIGLRFNAGRLQYTGSTAQSTDRYIRVGLGGAVLDASGSLPEATMSFTAASSPNFFASQGNRTVTFTGTNIGLNSFAMAIPQVSGLTTVVKSGAGTWRLTGESTYTGETLFQGGVLEVSALTDYGVAGPLGARASSQDQTVAEGGSIGLRFQGGTLRYAGATAQSTNRAIRMTTAGGTLDASGSVPEATMSFTAASSPNLFEGGGSRTLTLTGSNTGDNTFAMQLTNESTNPTSLVKSGPGKWVLTGANTYTGETLFQGGVLEVSALTDYGVAGPLGARASSQEGVSGSIGLRFQGGTLRYAGATAQSTNRAIRMSLAGGTLDASGSVPEATMSFTAAPSPNFFESPGNRTLTLTGSNTGDNTFAMQLTN